LGDVCHSVHVKVGSKTGTAIAAEITTANATYFPRILCREGARWRVIRVYWQRSEVIIIRAWAVCKH